MIILSEYLMEKMYFNSFDEVKKYYNRETREDIKDLDDLSEDLEREYDGMEYPKLTVID